MTLPKICLLSLEAVPAPDSANTQHVSVKREKNQHEPTRAETSKPHMKQKGALQSLTKAHAPLQKLLFQFFFFFNFLFLTSSDILWALMAGGVDALLSVALCPDESQLWFCSPCPSKAPAVSRTLQGKFAATAWPGAGTAKPAPVGSSGETLYYIFHYTYLILACVHLVFVQ